MKKTLLVLALTGSFGVAAAQGLAGMPTTKPVVSTGAVSVGAAPTTVTANKPDPHINPFNGKMQNAEQIQRELEQARMETQMLEERLKQTNLSEELKTVPLRKAVEVAQAATAVKKEEASQKDIEATMRAPKMPPAVMAGASRTSVAPAVKPIPVKKAARPVVSKTSPKADASSKSEGSVTAAPLPRPTLVSVMAVGNSRSAVLEFAGGTMIVSDGDSTPFGVLKVRDRDSVDLGGSPLRVHSATMARFVVSDAKAVMQNGGTPQTGAAAVATPVAVPVVNTSPVATITGLPAQANGPLPSLPLPPSTPASAALGAKAGLPPLQLPPGVNLLPASN